jgi:predicted ferric reductase
MNDIDHTYWYLTRASGFVAYLLLFASVTLGLSMTGDVVERWLRRYRVYDLHRFLSLFTLLVTAFHVLIVLPDEFIAFSPIELLVPFASPYEPLFIALGGFSLYLTGFIVATFYLRSVIPYPAWRLIHYATFGAYVLALAHAIGAGTDTEAAWARYLYAVTALVVFNLLVYRALKGSARGIPQARTASSDAIATSRALRR